MPRVSEGYYKHKKQQIIDAAYRVCVRKPVTSVEMKDIIKETGFSHGVIYRYYKDLDEVLCDLVISINRTHRMDDRVDKVIEQVKDQGGEWEKTIKDLCTMLADYMEELGPDLMRVSLYFDAVAMSRPETVMRLAGKISEEAPSPLLYLAGALTDLLQKAVKSEKLKPIKPVDQIIQFFVASFQGIQTAYVMTSSLPLEGLHGRYKTHDMFSCLAGSMIAMAGGSL